MSTASPLLKLPDVAAYLGLATSTVYEMAKRGDFPCAILRFGGTQYVSRLALDAALAGRREAEAAALDRVLALDEAIDNLTARLDALAGAFAGLGAALTSATAPAAPPVVDIPSVPAVAGSGSRLAMEKEANVARQMETAPRPTRPRTERAAPQPLAGRSSGRPRDCRDAGSLRREAANAGTARGAHERRLRGLPAGTPANAPAD